MSYFEKRKFGDFLRQRILATHDEEMLSFFSNDYALKLQTDIIIPEDELSITRLNMRNFEDEGFSDLENAVDIMHNVTEDANNPKIASFFALSTEKQLGVINGAFDIDVNESFRNKQSAVDLFFFDTVWLNSR
jgi:hypothetical protein